MKNVELLQKVPLFRGLDEKDLAKLAAIATEKSYMAGDVIFGEGTVGDSMFIVESGTVRVLKRGEDEIVRMSTGQHFGEMALIDDETRSATADVIEMTQVIRIGRGDLEKLLAQDVSLSNRVYKAFTKYLCSRLRQTTSDLSFMREITKRRAG